MAATDHMWLLSTCRKYVFNLIHLNIHIWLVATVQAVQIQAFRIRTRTSAACRVIQKVCQDLKGGGKGHKGDKDPGFEDRE